MRRDLVFFSGFLHHFVLAKCAFPSHKGVKKISSKITVGKICKGEMMKNMDHFVKSVSIQKLSIILQIIGHD